MRPEAPSGQPQQLSLAVKLRDDARFSNFHGSHNTAALARLRSRHG